MAACHPRAAVQHLRLPDPGQIGLGPSINSHGPKPLAQQPHYPPHPLNWVYLAIADQNRAQPPDQVHLKPRREANNDNPKSFLPSVPREPYVSVFFVSPGQASTGDLERFPGDHASHDRIAALPAPGSWIERFRPDRRQPGRQHRRSRGSFHGAGPAGQEADQETASQLPVPPVLQEGPLHQGLPAGVYPRRAFLSAASSETRRWTRRPNAARDTVAQLNAN